VGICSKCWFKELLKDNTLITLAFMRIEPSTFTPAPLKRMHDDTDVRLLLLTADHQTHGYFVFDESAKFDDHHSSLTT